jgi:exo-beta-1,3-glucanase (GH17 family)
MAQLLLLFWLNIFHPFYVSVTEIVHYKKTGTVQVSVRVFFDDFEKALESKYKKKVNILKPTNKEELEALITLYIKDHLKIKANGKVLDFQFQGYEIEEDAAWCYFETSKVKAIKELSVENDILFEQHSSQSNMIHAIVDGKRKSTKLDNPKKTVSFIY